jgi:hypothetical protein
LRTAFEQLFEIQRQAKILQPETWAVLEKSVGNGGSKKAGELLELFTNFESLITQIQDLGIEIKDLETGLVDFPSMRGQEVVYLCWKYNEPTIAYWHPLDGGFAGRQSL